MATFQLGPEAPRPFSVLTEGHIRHEVKLPYVPECERYTLGPVYENNMVELVHKHLEVGTDDNLCYVGDPKGSLGPMLQNRFCLLEPVVSVMPGHIHYEESPGHKMIPFKSPNVGAEDYFKRESQNKPQFTKVLVKDSVQFFDDPKKTYENLLKTVKEFGKLLIIHRPAPMNTLPIFKDAKERLEEHDHSYLNIIQDLQAIGLDVQWEIECLKIVVPKLKWLGMLKERFPPMMQIASQFEVSTGLREISEGVFKYEGEMVEFQDRLLFISAQRPITTALPTLKRHGTSAQTQMCKEDLKYKMEVTNEIDRIIQHKEKNQRKRGIRRQ